MKLSLLLFGSLGTQKTTGLECDPGFELFDGECTDINECDIGTCSKSATCENSVGGFTCTCPAGFDDTNGDGTVCAFTNYPDGWNWYPMFDEGSEIWISGNDPETPFATSFFSIYSALGDLNLDLMLCQDYYTLPFGVLKPGVRYACDDAVQRFGHPKYANQDGQCCSYKDYIISCECNADTYHFIGRTKTANAFLWDSDAMGTYAWTSNDGNVYDTAVGQMAVSQDAAAQICAAHGGRLFNEEVYLWTPESFFSAPNLGGCNAVVEMYSKAHGRLYQVPKMIPGYTGRALTGYRANADLSNWCWFDGTTCHDTQSNTPIGVYIEAQTGWLPLSGEPDCNVGQIATAINNALSSELANIPATPAKANDCLAMDLDIKQMVVVDCDSGTYDAFVCEREHWDCAVNGGSGPCSHECNSAGYCQCPDGMFLTDFTTCTEQPGLELIECFPTHMVAWFPVADVNYAAELQLNDPTCTDQIAIVDNMYRIEVRFDECGTTARYASNFSEIIFANSFSNYLDYSAKINIESRVTNQFECHFDSIINVQDVNGAGQVDCDPSVVTCNEPGEPGTIDVESERSTLRKEELGKFSFDILTYTGDGFSQELADGFNSRVGETLHYAVVPNNILANLVYQTTSCSILNHNKNVSYTLFQDEQVDPFVTPVRYRPYFSDGLGAETCAVERQDKFSYTVFEFLDGKGGASGGQEQHIKCTVMVCIKEDDMSNSPCAPSSCTYWDETDSHDATGTASARKRRSNAGISFAAANTVTFGKRTV